MKDWLKAFGFAAIFTVVLVGIVLPAVVGLIVLCWGALYYLLVAVGMMP